MKICKNFRPSIFLLANLIFRRFNIIENNKIKEVINMTLNISGTSKFNNQVRNANLYNSLLDSKYKLSQYEVDLNAVDHIKDCIKNSTIGLLARKKTETNEFPKMKKMNMNVLHSSSEYQIANEKFVDSFISKYPKTAKARMFLINNGYVVLDKVKKINRNFKRYLFKFCGL